MNSYQIIGIDTGGTFVDFVAIRDGRMEVFKIPSTPHNPSEAVIAGVRKLGDHIHEIIHGTTVTTNAVLERKGARVTLLTTEGFKDVVEIGRQNRSDIYEIVPSRPEPLVPRERRVGVKERIRGDGSVEKALDKSEIEKMKLPQGTESVAIVYLFSFLHPEHEEQTKKILRKMYPDVSVSISYEVLPEYREYERTSTTVMDAYVKPLMVSYMSNLVESVQGHCDLLAIMKSSAGLATPKGLQRKPVETLVSGLAGGILAAEMCSKLTGIPNLISVDIGGTSTDVAQITGGKGQTHRSMDIDGLPVNVQTVDVKTIGAGGGSIASVKSGLLHVGPESAAGSPGPAAYDMGGKDATVTDADLLYGILGKQLAGGILTLKPEKAVEALEQVGVLLDLDLHSIVRGVRRVFHENIAAALRNVSTDRGVDPRNYALVAFGGAGPVHATALADLLGITKVIIPPYPGTWSAVGLLSADYRYDMSRGIIKPLETAEMKEIDTILKELETEVMKHAKEDGILSSTWNVRKMIDLRFKGQSYEITVDKKENLKELTEEFFNKHREIYGFVSKDEPVELVAIRLSLVIPHPTPDIGNIEEREPEIVEYRKVLDVGEVPVYRRENLGTTEFSGPLIVDQRDSTVWIPEGWLARQDQKGFMYLEGLQ